MQITYSAPLPPPRFNMAAYALTHAAVAPTHPALLVIDRPDGVTAAEIWSYARLRDAVLRVAAGLRGLGLKPGAHVLIRLDNSSSYAILFFAAIAAGLVPIPASSQLTGSEAGFIVRDSEAAAVIIDPALALSDTPSGLAIYESDILKRLLEHDLAPGFADTQADDPAFLIYTSGTTARPKGVLHAHRSAWGRRPMYQGWYGIAPSDRILHAGAFNWTFTLGTGLTDPWANGATAMVYTGERDPSYWPGLMQRHAATQFAAVPGLFRQILKYGAVDVASLSQLRHGLVAGETMPAALFDDWQQASGTPLYEALGMSEISTYISSAPDVPRRAGCIGRPQEGRVVAILPLDSGSEPLPAGKVGLLGVHRSDPGLMLNYWQRPTEAAQAWREDWFIGGDLAEMDDDGYVIHHGRANDLMNAFGYRVSPLEVEAALATHSGIAEIAVSEVRLRTDLSVIAAFIIQRAGAELTAEQLRAYAGERLAVYKVPREFVFVDALPRTANGKIRRSDLRHPDAKP